MKKKISAVYKIVNEVTGDSYIGSSKDVYRRWGAHKSPSTWGRKPNNKMYQDMQKYGLDKFRFQILCPVMPEYLTQVEQECIDLMKPTYNDRNSKGLDVERLKESWKKYKQSEKCKETRKKYDNQLCNYNGETLTMCALASRFRIAGIPHATVEAKKYLITTQM